MKMDIYILKDGTMKGKCKIISCLCLVFQPPAMPMCLLMVHALPNSDLAWKRHDLSLWLGAAAACTGWRVHLYVDSIFFFHLKSPLYEIELIFIFFNNPVLNIRAHSFIWSSHSLVQNVPSHLLSNLLWFLLAYVLFQVLQSSFLIGSVIWFLCPFYNCYPFVRLLTKFSMEMPFHREIL